MPNAFEEWGGYGVFEDVMKYEVNFNYEYIFFHNTTRLIFFFIIFT
jgi:hypothetical protein